MEKRKPTICRRAFPLISFNRLAVPWIGTVRRRMTKIMV
jgi:hypothetical protein